MNVRNRYPGQRHALFAALIVLSVPAAPRAQLMQRGSPLQQAAGAQAGAQRPTPARVLTLDEALEIAGPRSEQVTIAAAGVSRAESQQQRIRSEWLPQLSASGSYDRALASEFSGIFDSAGPACTPFTLDAQAPLQDRVAEIERALRDCPPAANPFGGSGSDDDDGGNALPFGQANSYRINLAFSQNVYTGGRLSAQQAQARLGRDNAALTLASTRAQVSLDVAQAYFDAALSDRLVVIAEATLAQAEGTAEQVRLQREAGRIAEFDLLRAQVSRDTQRPEVIRRRNARDLAYLRLKQLLDLPLDQPLQLVSTLEDAVLPPPAARWADAIAAAEAGSAAARVRTAVTQASNDVQQSEAGIRVARSQRLPTVSVSSAYGRVAYAGVPRFGDFRTNWTIGATASMPLFTGGRIKADELTARANLVETGARLQLTRELATLEEASTRLALTNARAAWESTAGIVQQAQRAYEIAELRYREGLSTQLELSDARLLLQQAQASRAQAARDLQLVRVRLALLPELPLSAGAGDASAAQAQAQQTAPAPAAAAPGTAAATTRTGSQRE